MAKLTDLTLAELSKAMARKEASALEVTDGGIAEKVLANAPGGAVYIDPTDKHAGGFFTVPKVVE